MKQVIGAQRNLHSVEAKRLWLLGQQRRAASYHYYSTEADTLTLCRPMIQAVSALIVLGIFDVPRLARIHIAY
jgi:hypothetical protein